MRKAHAISIQKFCYEHILTQLTIISFRHENSVQSKPEGEKEKERIIEAHWHEKIGKPIKQMAITKAHYILFLYSFYSCRLLMCFHSNVPSTNSMCGWMNGWYKYSPQWWDIYRLARVFSDIILIHNYYYSYHSTRSYASCWRVCVCLSFFYVWLHALIWMELNDIRVSFYILFCTCQSYLSFCSFTLRS